MKTIALFRRADKSPLVITVLQKTTKILNGLNIERNALKGEYLDNIIHPLYELRKTIFISLFSRIFLPFSVIDSSGFFTPITAQKKKGNSTYYYMYNYILTREIRQLSITTSQSMYTCFFL